MTRYAHLNKINISNREKVKAGDLIGGVGNSGYGSGSRTHLHYEIWVDGNRISPRGVFPMEDQK